MKALSSVVRRGNGRSVGCEPERRGVKATRSRLRPITVSVTSLGRTKQRSSELRKRGLSEPWLACVLMHIKAQYGTDLYTALFDETKALFCSWVHCRNLPSSVRTPYVPLSVATFPSTHPEIFRKFWLYFVSDFSEYFARKVSSFPVKRETNESFWMFFFYSLEFFNWSSKSLLVSAQGEGFNFVIFITFIFDRNTITLILDILPVVVVDYIGMLAFVLG